MKQTTVQKLEVFEKVIDSSMGVKQVLKILKSLDDVEIENSRSSRGQKSITIKRGPWDKSTRYYMYFEYDRLFSFDCSTTEHVSFFEERN